jgi:hypothetical protein
VVVIQEEDGTKVSSTRIENSPMNLAAAVAEAGPEPEVVLEATWGWYWAADVFEEAGVIHVCPVQRMFSATTRNDASHPVR